MIKQAAFIQISVLSRRPVSQPVGDQHLKAFNLLSLSRNLMATAEFLQGHCQDQWSLCDACSHSVMTDARLQMPIPGTKMMLAGAGASSSTPPAPAGAASSTGMIMSTTISSTTSNDNTTFLRGIVPTNASGISVFQTIFPGWYSGRATHVHAKVISASSLQFFTCFCIHENVASRYLQANL